MLLLLHPLMKNGSCKLSRVSVPLVQHALSGVFGGILLVFMALLFLLLCGGMEGVRFYVLTPSHLLFKLQAAKKIADAKLAKDFQWVLKEFQRAQRLAAERETTYAPFVPKEVLSSR